MLDSFVTQWTVAQQPPLFMGFPRQEYWNELPFPSPGDLPNPKVEHMSPALAENFFATKPPGKRICMYVYTHTHTHTHTGILLSHKKNEIMPFSATRMDLEIIILHEVSQKEKNKYHMISLICGIKNTTQMNISTKEKLTHRI